MAWASNIVVFLLVAGGMWAARAAARNRFWRESAIELWRRRPVAIVTIAVFVFVALLDSLAWVGGARDGAGEPPMSRGGPRHRPRPDVHCRPRQHRCELLTMIRLNLTAAPAWLTLAPGLRLQVAPLLVVAVAAPRQLVEDGGQRLLIAKGAPESVLPLCAAVAVDRAVRTRDRRTRIVC